MHKRSVLVTGAAGFLGSHLVTHHLSNGDFVVGVDNYCTSMGNHENKSTWQVGHIRNSNYHFVNADITSVEWMNELFHEKFDLIYNFACPASPPRYQALALETLMTCTLGYKNVLEVAKRSKSVVVHASTSEIYGDPLVSPQHESHWGNVNSYGIRSCYDEGKRAAEAMSWIYHNKHNVDIRLMRIFNTYGPRMDPNDGRVVSNFLSQGIQGQSLTVYGKGTQTRSFCYVDDLISGAVKLGSLEKNPKTPINIGNPSEFTIYELAQLVQKMYDVKIVFKPLPQDDPTQRKPDISKAIEILGWTPRISLQEGLYKSSSYFESVIKMNNAQ